MLDPQCSMSGRSVGLVAFVRSEVQLPIKCAPCIGPIRGASGTSCAPCLFQLFPEFSRGTSGLVGIILKM